MGTVSIRQAREQFSELVGAVERGESIIITRRGRRVARLTPVPPERRKGLPDLTDFRASLKVKGSSLTRVLLAQRRQERS